MGWGGSVHCGMLRILLLAEPVEFSAEPDTSTSVLSFLLGVYSFLKRSKTQKWSRAVSNSKKRTSEC